MTLQTYPRPNGPDLFNREWAAVAPFCKGPRGLDIGCGSWKVNWKAIGVDVNPLVQPDLICDAIRLPFPDASMDFVAAIHSLEHFFYTGETLTEWCRVLKPGAPLALVVRDRRCVPDPQSEDNVHLRFFAPDELRAVVERMPWLEVVRCDTLRNGHSFALVARRRPDVSVPPTEVRPVVSRAGRTLTILWSGTPELQRAARAMGHHVITIGHWDYTHFKFPFGAQVSVPRLLDELRAVGVRVDLVIEQEANFFFAGLAERPSWLPTVHTVCNAWDFNRIDRCRLFDFNFISQKGFLEEYRRRGNPKTWWWPHWADPDIFAPWDEPEEFDVGTLGQMGQGYEDRRRLWEAIRQRFRTPDFAGGLWWEAAARFYRRCRIVLNRSAGFRNVNERPFHALACGRLMVTDRVGHGLEDLFRNGEHLVLYDSDEECLALIDHYLRHPEERQRIAEAGRREVLAHHLPVHRVQTILRTVFGEGAGVAGCGGPVGVVSGGVGGGVPGPGRGPERGGPPPDTPRSAAAVARGGAGRQAAERPGDPRNGGDEPVRRGPGPVHRKRGAGDPPGPPAAAGRRRGVPRPHLLLPAPPGGPWSLPPGLPLPETGAGPAPAGGQGPPPRPVPERDGR